MALSLISQVILSPRCSLKQGKKSDQRLVEILRSPINTSLSHFQSFEMHLIFSNHGLVLHIEQMFLRL